MIATLDRPIDLLPDVVDDGTRREFIVGGGLSLGALLLTGCGDSASDAPAAANEAGFPVRITHKYGSTTIDERPTRVVTLGSIDRDPVLALGVTPVAVLKALDPTYFPWNENKVGSPPPTELPGMTEKVDIDVEQVAAQSPDLILAQYSDLSKDLYDKLSRLAPTVAPAADTPPFGMPWQSMTRVVGKALGQSEQAERLVSGVERQLAEIKAAHPELVGKTITLAGDFGDGQVYITPATSTRYAALEALGLDPDVPGLDGVKSLSFEQLDKLNGADVVIWGPRGAIDEEPAYRSQPIHTQGRDLFPDETISVAINFPSVLSIPYLARRLTPELVAAADRDPATRASMRSGAAS